MIPSGYVSGPSQSGRGTVPQAPGSTGDANTIQIFPPTAQYPNGCWRQFDSKGNPIDPSTGKQGTGPQNHLVPLPPGFLK
jgi:hypothetical protein